MKSKIKSFHFIFIVAISCNSYVEIQCNTYQDQGGNLDAFMGPTFRYLRNIPGGKDPRNKGVRFAWQNPLRVAPTLPPVAPPMMDTNPLPWTEKYIQTTQPGSTYPRKPPSQCPPGRRMGRSDDRCHTLGSKESCNENMAFYAESTNEKYGHCDCLQNANRPLVYHRETDKCYFVFQQAFCPDGSWLVVDSQRAEPFCDQNRCRNFTADKHDSEWDWKFNGESLAGEGPVALLNERTCAILGWPCDDEGTQKIKDLLPDRLSGEIRNSVRLRFDGTNLVCSRERFQSESSSLTIMCKAGLFNKWKEDGECL